MFATSLTPLTLDISGDPETPVPQSLQGDRCRCCGVHTAKLWNGARSGHPEAHQVCTLCYLVGHLDSPTAAHGRLAFLPGFSVINAQHFQRRVLLAVLAGDRAQQREGQRLMRWLQFHAREVERAWGTARACEFADAFKRLAPRKRQTLQSRLAGCVLLLPADVFDDLSLLLPANKTPASMLTPHSWGTYTRSDLYAEASPLG